MICASPNSIATTGRSRAARARRADVLPAPREGKVQAFTASQYAEVLGVSRQAVAKMLRGIAAMPIVADHKDRDALAWSIASIPPEMLSRLSDIARRLGLGSPAELMASRPRACHRFAVAD